MTLYVAEAEEPGNGTAGVDHPVCYQLASHPEFRGTCCLSLVSG